MSDEGLSHALDTLSIRADIPAGKQVRGKSEGDIPSTYTSTRLDPPSALYPFSFVNGNDKSSNPSHFPNLLLNESVSDANKPLYPQKRPSDPGFGGVSLVSTPANLPGNSVFSSRTPECFWCPTTPTFLLYGPLGSSSATWRDHVNLD